MKTSEFYKLFLIIEIIFATLMALPLTSQAATPCCGITAIDQMSGVVTAKNNATGRNFQFKALGFDPVDSVRVMKSFHVGQKVFVNFKSGKVSLDGKKTCCMLVGHTSGGSGSTPNHVVDGTIVRGAISTKDAEDQYQSSCPQGSHARCAITTTGSDPGTGDDEYSCTCIK